MNSGWIRADWPAPGGVLAGTTLRGSRFELPAEPQWLNQVHGADVVYAGSPDFDEGPPNADAIVTDKAGVCCAVRTADCLPLLLCSAHGTEIAAVHGGWRGLAAGVIEKTIAAMSTPPGNILAWLGPAISQSAFEVGGEVRAAFLSDDAAAVDAFTVNDRGRWQADLYKLAAQRLTRAGVSRVFGGGLCTHADAERFYSYRRDGETGRMVSFIFRRVWPIGQGSDPSRPTGL
ncbi:MAG: peptidoglycan editing factor PgeF [Gammaproteobacteria bacterium]|nr:peptidoglycan editing factor PgeF [Gammaproteobacteria bacterium]MDH3431151.1 peptidoglycan editing factor PgeF [Gammaproteobacteria bacterium]MDH3434467.1 peptidoglycan editing factor PgeF [Gammaproteobacteria bacterium]